MSWPTLSEPAPTLVSTMVKKNPNKPWIFLGSNFVWIIAEITKHKKVNWGFFF
jgi:hypothetical protein